MAKKVSFSNENLSIEDIVYYKEDLEKAIRLYYKSYNEYKKFYTYNMENINEEDILNNLPLKEVA